MSADRQLLHRELVSAVASLAITGHQGVYPHLWHLNYRLHGLEVDLLFDDGGRLSPDIHLVNAGHNLSMLVDCKGSEASIKRQQTESYLKCSGRLAILQAGVNSPDPDKHKLDVGFFVTTDLADVAASEISIAKGAVTVEADGLGLIEIKNDSFGIRHDELSDPVLSSSLASGWQVRIRDLPLNLIPFEASVPTWDLASSILPEILGYFIGGRDVFSATELCRDTHPYWELLGPDTQALIVGRVRNMVKELRGTAFKGWLRRDRAKGGIEEQWIFTRQSRQAPSTIRAFKRRADKYIEVLEDGRAATPDDFVNIDQLGFDLDEAM